jgi:hypothetical protein
MMLKRLSALAMVMLMLVSFISAGSAAEVIELRVLNYLDMTGPNSSEDQGGLGCLSSGESQHQTRH